MRIRIVIAKNFKTTIPLIFLLAATGLAFLLYYSYNETMSLVKGQFNKQQVLVAKQTALGIEKNIKLAARELEDLSRQPAIRNFKLEDSRTIMKEKLEHVKDLHVNDVGLLDSKGIVRIALHAPHLVGTDFSRREYFQKARTMKTGKTAFKFITFKGIDTGEKGIAIAMPLFSPDKKFSGVVVFTVKINELIEGFFPLQTDDRTSCVIDSKGNVLCDPRKLVKGKLIEKIPNIDPAFRKCIEDAKTGRIVTCEYISPEGERKIAVSYPIKIADQTWSMITATPEEMLSKLLKPFSVRYTIATLVALIAVASASVITIYFINTWNLELDSIVKIRTKELYLSEEKLRSLVETINDFVWEIAGDGKYIYVSPIAKKILGYTPEELMEKTIFDFMPEGEAEKFKKALQDIGDSKQPFNNLERTSIHKNGKTVILETNGSPILDTKGNLLGFSGADRDVTLRKQAEKELQKYALELEEARNNLERKVEERTAELTKTHDLLIRKEKLATLGELSSSVSHELRNPLGVIKNAIYFFKMKMDTFEDETVKENIKIIEREINISNKIISDLLDFTRGKSPVRLDIEINQLVREMLSKSLIPANIKVVTDLSEGIPPVPVDPTQVAQVFLNLIENGVQSMGQGGTFKVSTRLTNNTAKVIFADEGCGIPETDLGRIFEPLFTTKAKGIGLGLAISKSMAEANGGSIVVESTEGRGSTVTVSFSKEG